MKIAVFGRTGQVATELGRLSGAGGPEITLLGRNRVDFSDPDAVEEVARGLDCEAMINAVAYTAVDRAEEEEPLATLINGDSPGRLARVAADRGLPLVHISTDYVFDGTGTAPFAPGHPTGPLGAYGRSKLAGEAAVRAAGGVHVILRTSWVFSAHGTNFVKTMLRLAQGRDGLNVVADQVGGPTPAASIAEACATIAKRLKTDPDTGGTYHFAGLPLTSWAGFARETFARADLPVRVTDIPTSAYPTPATRPLNSRLDCSLTERTFGLRCPDWRAGLDRVLDTL